MAMPVTAGAAATSDSMRQNAAQKMAPAGSWSSTGVAMLRRRPGRSGTSARRGLVTTTPPTRWRTAAASGPGTALW